VQPSGASVYDPNAVTGELPSGGSAPEAESTRVLPPTPDVPQGPPQAQGPHPWESQLSAARQRNDQTDVQPVAPEMDPLRRRPVRRPQPQQQPQQPYGGRRGQPYPQQGAQGQGYGYPQQQPRHQQPQPQNYDRQRYEPQRPPAPQAPEPSRGRESRRSANPVKIPGLGCLKGCLTVILVVIVVFVIVWYTTPLPDWVNSTRNLWDATSSWVNTAWDKISAITGDSGGGSGNS
jgi:serine/threonine-protein kinase